LAVLAWASSEHGVSAATKSSPASNGGVSAKPVRIPLSRFSVLLMF
jgi:hypothetical protein